MDELDKVLFCLVLILSLAVAAPIRTPHGPNGAPSVALPTILGIDFFLVVFISPYLIADEELDTVVVTLDSSKISTLVILDIFISFNPKVTVSFKGSKYTSPSNTVYTGSGISFSFLNLVSLSNAVL